MSAFYGMTARSLRGEPVTFKDYAGKAVLAVNTATHCGLAPQYAGLEALYGKYRDRGLVVLAFPCNQFGRQEPGDDEAIGQTCQRNYGVTFPVFGKIEVNGPGAHPLFQWLTARLPGLVGRRVRWNFTKFLIGQDGMPLKRFAPITAPARLEPAVRAALGA